MSNGLTFRGISEERFAEIERIAWALVLCAVTNPSYPSRPVALLERGVEFLNSTNEQILLAMTIGGINVGTTVQQGVPGVYYPRFYEIANLAKAALPGVEIFTQEHIPAIVSAITNHDRIARAVFKQIPNVNLN